MDLLVGMTILKIQEIGVELAQLEIQLGMEPTLLEL
jgi:hypothetical protein